MFIMRLQLTNEDSQHAHMPGAYSSPPQPCPVLRCGVPPFQHVSPPALRLTCMFTLTGAQSLLTGSPPCSLSGSPHCHTATNVFFFSVNVSPTASCAFVSVENLEKCLTHESERKHNICHIKILHLCV